MNWNIDSLWVAALLLGLLAACGDQSNPPVLPAAVKVNGHSISIAELAAKSSGMDGMYKDGVKEQVLQKAIDMELLRQAAVQEKLDGEDNVRAKIALSTRTILAMAYMEKKLASVPQPSDAELVAYFNDNPSRFGNRKHYDFHEFSIQPAPGSVNEVLSYKAKTWGEYKKLLTDKGIQHQSSRISVLSDQLSDDVLIKLKGAAVGDAVTIVNGEHLNVIFVLDQRDDPVQLGAAKPLIANMIADKRKKSLLDDMVSQVREKAIIEYVAPFTAKGLAPDGNAR